MNKNAKVVFLMFSVLIMIGIVMLYSSSAIYAYGKYGDSLYFVKRHLMHLALGLIAMIFCMTVPIGWIKENARNILFILIAFLILVLIPGIGSQVGGARRWIRFMDFGFQPSEMAKFALVIYLAELTTRKRYIMWDVRHGFFAPFCIIAFVGGLVLLEPDMGSAVAIFFIGMMMLFISGTRLKHLFFVALAMVPGLFLAVIYEPYRFKRILTFLNPWEDIRGAGFQIIQSFIALGSGGFFGLGLGQSKQKLFYLPESYTDFMFSIIGEELGFLGAGIVLAIFALFIYFAMRTAFRINDLFMSRVVFGISMMIVFEILVNIGVSTGVLPTKGLPLPFISYGGSSLVAHLAIMGIFFNMARQAEE